MYVINVRSNTTALVCLLAAAAVLMAYPAWAQDKPEGGGNRRVEPAVEPPVVQDPPQRGSGPSNTGGARTGETRREQRPTEARREDRGAATGTSESRRETLPGGETSGNSLQKSRPRDPAIPVLGTGDPNRFKAKVRQSVPKPGPQPR